MQPIRKIALLPALLLLLSAELNSQALPTDFIYSSFIGEHLETPMRLAIDAQDNIYVTDVNTKCIRVFAPGGTFLDSLAMGFFPVSIAFNPEGILFFGDEATGYIYRLNGTGQPELFYNGTIYPSSMAFSPDNILYVADNELKKVLAIDLSGDLVGTIGEGKLIFPTGLEFDAENNRILVSEHGGIGADVQGAGMFGKGPLVNVYIYDRQGNLLGSFGGFGSTGGKFYRTQGMCIGRCNNIYVCEPFQGNVSVFNENGVFITKFGTYGDSISELLLPMDITFDSQDRIIISCYNKGTLEIFTINAPMPSASVLTPDVAVCEGATAEISFRLTGTPPWSFTYSYNGGNPITYDNILSSPYTLAVSGAGDYRPLGIADANGTGTCVSGTARVTHHPQPTASITCGDLTTCQGTPVVIPVNFTGDAPWTFTFTRNGSDPVTIRTTHNPYLLEVTEAGLYAITALSGRGCEGSVFTGSSTVTIIPKPTATFTVGTTRIHHCPYDPPEYLEIIFTGTPPWTFLWTRDDMDSTVVTTFDNPYYLMAASAGTYEVKVITDSYCSNNYNDSYPEIVIHALPTVQITIAQIGLCQNGTNHIPLQFTGRAPWTFTITRDGANPVTVTTSDNPYFYSVNKLGYYQVVALSDDYCTGNPVNVGVSVVRANPPTALMPTTSVILCAGQTADIPIQFTGASPWTFTYTLNNANPQTVTSTEANYFLQVSAPGSYKMTSLVDASCSAKKLPPPATVVQYPMPAAGFSYVANQLEVTFTNLSINATQYTWHFGDGNTSNEVNPVYTYAAPGNYEVTLEAYNNYCGPSTAIATITAELLKNAEATVVPVNQDDDGFDLLIYPNPSRGRFTLELKGICDGEIMAEVITLAGTVLLSEKLNTAGNRDEQGIVTKQFDLSPYGAGAYLVQVRCGDVRARQVVTIK